MVTGQPAADIHIDERLVRQLLQEQHAELAHLPLERVDAGWDNELYRLGSALAVRLPRRAVAASLIEREQRWLPVLAPRLPLQTSIPVLAGRPSSSFPWPWSISAWIAGTPADVVEPGANDAVSFAGFLRALHQPAPPDAPHNPLRGVPLRERAPRFDERLQRLAGVPAFTRVEAGLRRVWTDALDASPATERRWIHGDLHPLNVIVSDGDDDRRVVGVIDWGDLTAGDVATDLASVWMLFAGAEVRARVRAAYGDVDADTWVRARGWAVLFGVLLLDAGLVNSPRHAVVGKRILRRVLE